MATVEQQQIGEVGSETVADQKSLESRYIKLLERHVELLEDKMKNGSKDSVAPAASIGDPPPSISTDVPTQKDIDSSGERKIVYLKRSYDNNGLLTEKPYEPDAKAETPKEDAIATVVMHYNANTRSSSEITIGSAAARAILKDKLRHYPGYHWDNPTSSITSPFVPWVHNWDVLEEASRADTDGARDLAQILEAARKSSSIEDYLKRRKPTTEEESKDDAKDMEKGKEEVQEELVSFDSLWTIFKPGELVYMPNSFMKQEQVFIFQEIVEDGNRGSNEKHNLVYCWSYDWDGTSQTFNRVCVELKIDHFKNQKPITSLPCYPLSYCSKEKANDVRTRLIERGKRFRAFCTSPRGKQMFEYSGMAHYRGTGVRGVGGGGPASGSYDDASSQKAPPFLDRTMSSSYSGGSGRPLDVKGQVMVDFESYARHGPSDPKTMGDLTIDHTARDTECRCDACDNDNGPKANQRYHWDNVGGEADFEDDQFLICPPRVLGYHLMEKKWVELLVNNVNEIKHRQITDAFDKLQLANKQKTLIRELVQSHANDKITESKSLRGQMHDLMKGKGEGLVILLHGPPGVGKTLTAESVAQLTGKPLFSIGVGDVTTDPSQLEKRLEQLFELAAVWRAVMLFDEADVFLESRAATTDVTRVGLVSVLLRVLEYYKGILILTTNRIRSFDIAVQSRINLAIRFTDLIEKQKKAIFTNLIDQLDNNLIQDRAALIKFLDEDDEATKQFSDLNGRQVRNIVFSAASLAGNRPAGENVLKLEDVKRMLDETCSFQRHLAELTKSTRDKAE